MKQVQLLTENLTALGNEVFSYVKDKRNFVSKEDIEAEHKAFQEKDWKSDEEIKQLYEKDMEGLRESDVFIMILPAGNSSHITAGIAFALNKETILIGSPERAETHYRIFSKNYSSIEEYVVEVKDQAKAQLS